MAYPLEERIRICAAIGLLISEGWKISAAIEYHRIDRDSLSRWLAAETACQSAYKYPKIWLKWLAAEIYTPGTWRMKVILRSPLADPQSARPS